MSYSDCSSGIVLAASAKYVSGYYRLDVQLRASGVTRAETTFSYPFYYHPSLACAQTCPDLTVSDDAFFAAALASDGYYDRFKDSKRSLNATPTTLMFNTVSTKTPFIRFELQDPAHDPVSGLGNIVGAHLVKRNSLRRRFATYTAPGAAKPSLLLFARHIESSKQRAAANIQYCDNGFQFGISEVNDKLMTWTIPGAPHYEARSYDCDAIVINPKGEGSCFVIESGKPVRKISSVSMWYKVETDGGSNTGYHRHQHWSSSFLTLLDSPD